jgi:hypothetical protein
VLPYARGDVRFGGGRRRVGHAGDIGCGGAKL